MDQNVSRCASFLKTMKEEISSRIATGSTPKSLHYLAMRLMEDRIAHPDLYPARTLALDIAADLDLYHYAIFSDNVIVVSIVITSAIRNADEPRRHVFHIVTDPIYLPTMQVWFARNADEPRRHVFHKVTDPIYLPTMQVWFARRPPAGGAHVEVRSVTDFPFLNARS